MTPEHQGATWLLQILAEINATMIRISDGLRSRYAPERVVRGYDVRKYQADPIVEAYVEVEHSTDEAFCWWLDVSGGESGWRIEAKLLRTDRSGQDVVKTFTESTGLSIEQLREEVPVTLSRFVSSAEAFSSEKH